MPRRDINVLLVTFDQWRADSLSCLGHPVVKTPNVDALAADGVLFRNHYTQASPCGPARASLLTGLYLHNHRSVRNGTPLEARHATIAAVARQAGLDPILFGYSDTSLDPTGRPEGDPALATYEGVLPGFREGLLLPERPALWADHLRGLGYRVGDNPRSAWTPATRARLPGQAPAIYRPEHSETAFLTNRALAYLSEQDRPGWFVHLSYLRPHPPWIAPAPFHQLYAASALPPPRRAPTREAEAAQHAWLAWRIAQLQGENVPVEEDRPMRELDADGEAQLRAVYFGLLSHVDAEFGRVIAHLKATGDYRRTLIVLTADHGEQLGDHWLWGKAGYFDAAFHVPLILRAPEGNRGEQVAAFSEAVDVMPTILERLGFEVPHACDGFSLAPWLHGAPRNWREAAYFEYDFREVRDESVERTLGLVPDQCSLAAITDGKYKYVQFAGLPSLFFDLARDPHELANRIADPAYAALALSYAQKLLGRRMSHAPRAMTHLHLGPGGVAARPGPRAF